MATPAVESRRDVPGPEPVRFDPSVLEFLAAASQSLSESSFDLDSTLQHAAGLAVPFLADLCAVDLLEADGRFREGTIVHRDAALAEVCRRARFRFLETPDVPHGVAEVARTERSVMLREVADSFLRAAARDEEHLRLLRELHPRSSMSVPLKVHGRLLGVMTLVSVTAERTYGPTELLLAEDLAARIAVAVDNARLYREANESQARLHRQLFFSLAVTNYLGEGVVALDREGRTTFANPAAAALLGGVQAAGNERWTTGSLDELGTCLVEQVSAAGKTVRVSGVEFRRSDGSTLPVAYTAAPMWEEDRMAGVVVVFQDLSERRRAEDLARESQANAARAEELRRELASLEGVARPASTVTAGIYGRKPLRDEAPDVFDGLVGRYRRLLGQAIEEQVYRVQHSLSQRLHGLGEELGAMGAGPRDLIDLHTAALAEVRSEEPTLKVKAYMEEGRIRLLELMGHLASYYRRHSVRGRSYPIDGGAGPIREGADG